MTERDYDRCSYNKLCRIFAKRLDRRFRGYRKILPIIVYRMSIAISQSQDIWLNGDDGRKRCFCILNYAKKTRRTISQK